jgi:hypothetical protein
VKRTTESNFLDADLLHQFKVGAAIEFCESLPGFRIAKVVAVLHYSILLNDLSRTMEPSTNSISRIWIGYRRSSPSQSAWLEHIRCNSSASVNRWSACRTWVLNV